MKKKNAFTDALDKELSDRKILNKAKDKSQLKIVEEEIFLVEDKPKTVGEKIFPVEDKAEEVFIDYTRYLIDDDIQTKKVAKEPDFEKRVLAEAENDFFEEKQPENIGANFRSRPKEKFRQSNFRSQTVQEISADVEQEPEIVLEFENRKMTRAELAGIGLSAIAMLYSFSTLDKPLFFLALSLFTHLMRPLIGAFFGKNNRAVQNGLRSFSIVLFAGSILLLFMSP